MSKYRRGPEATASPCFQLNLNWIFANFRSLGGFHLSWIWQSWLWQKSISKAFLKLITHFYISWCLTLVLDNYDPVTLTQTPRRIEITPTVDRIFLKKSSILNEEILNMVVLICTKNNLWFSTIILRFEIVHFRITNKSF